MMEPPRFCADVHLGKLARLLRMLGFDTLYQNDFSKQQLYEFANSENRILLSKDAGFARFRELQFFQIKSSDSQKQLQEVIEKYQLKKLFKPFTRCLYCNNLIVNRQKHEVEESLLPQTRQFFSDFRQCANCKRVYWKGSHYDRMMKLIESL